MSLAVQCWTRGVELVTAPGTTPGCLKLGEPVEGPPLTRGTETDSTPQVPVAAGAVRNREKPGQMCLFGAGITFLHKMPSCLQNVPRAAQDKQMKMRPSWFVWCLGLPSFYRS